MIEKLIPAFQIFYEELFNQKFDANSVLVIHNHFVSFLLKNKLSFMNVGDDPCVELFRGMHFSVR